MATARGTLGVDLQVISATPVLFSYNRPVEQALAVARIFNDAALEMCRRSNGGLRALSQVPSQDIDASCAEVSRCMKTGHVGVQIGNHVGSKNLDVFELNPDLEEIHKNGTPLKLFCFGFYPVGDSGVGLYAFQENPTTSDSFSGGADSDESFRELIPGILRRWYASPVLLLSRLDQNTQISSYIHFFVWS